MALRLTAEYVNGALKPLEPLHLQEGDVVTLYIEKREENNRKHHNALEIADRIRQSAPPGVWDETHTDEAKNYRHYLYGHPKEED